MIIFIILTIVVIAVLHIATKPDDVVCWGLWLVMAVGMMLITLLAGFVCSSHAATNTTVYSSDRYDTTITKNERYCILTRTINSRVAKRFWYTTNKPTKF